MWTDRLGCTCEGLLFPGRVFQDTLSTWGRGGYFHQFVANQAGSSVVGSEDIALPCRDYQDHLGNAGDPLGALLAMHRSLAILGKHSRAMCLPAALPNFCLVSPVRWVPPWVCFKINTPTGLPPTPLLLPFPVQRQEKRRKQTVLGARPVFQMSPCSHRCHERQSGAPHAERPWLFPLPSSRGLGGHPAAALCLDHPEICSLPLSLCDLRCSCLSLGAYFLVRVVG